MRIDLLSLIFIASLIYCVPKAEHNELKEQNKKLKAENQTLTKEKFDKAQADITFDELVEILNMSSGQINEIMYHKNWGRLYDDIFGGLRYAPIPSEELTTWIEELKQNYAMNGYGLYISFDDEGKYSGIRKDHPISVLYVFDQNDEFLAEVQHSSHSLSIFTSSVSFFSLSVSEILSFSTF